MRFMPISNRNKLIAGILVLVSAGVIGFGLMMPDTMNRIPYKDASYVSAGAEIYTAQCAACHGAQLEGQANWQDRDADGYLPAPPHDETGHTWHHPDKLLWQLTKYGVQSVAGSDYVSRMPAFENALTDDQIWAVLAYIKSEWPDEIASRHTEIHSK